MTKKRFEFDNKNRFYKQKIMDWIKNLFNGLIDGGENTWVKLSQVLGIAGNVVKNFDNDNSGFDDLAGNLLIANAKVCKKIGNGENKEIVIALDAVIENAQTLKNYLELDRKNLDFRATAPTEKVLY